MPGTPPLDGIRVVEVGNFMAGPFCAMQLADLGADVVKIENPQGGDHVRLTGPFIDGESSNFVRLNRNKRSLALNLKDPEGKEVFRKLVARTDVIVENLRPGTMADLELEYDRLERINPGLVYVAASGWGQSGPYSELAGLDIMAQGMSGLMSITGTEGGEPVKVGVPVCDLVCALYGALAAVSALRARERDGRGQFIDVSLLEAGVSLGVWEAGRYFATGEVPRPLGSAHQSTAPYQAFHASDGFFTAGVPSPNLWGAFLRALGLEYLERDMRFATNADRHSNREELIPLIEEVTVRQTREHWIAKFREEGVPCGAIQTFDQVFNDPHLNERGYFWDAPHESLGQVRQLGSPMRMTATPPRRDTAGPQLGQHSDEVLAELGYGPGQIRSLRAQAVTA
ncbi:MAG: CoA transferase [Candidatus Dormibacteraeota bacterium]|nr:CoA transferase [Candidatus Dormibacteraeota bacterium]